MMGDTPSTASSRDSTTSSSSIGSMVSFGTIQIREYERVLGHGDPFMCLELGWEYKESQQLHLDECEIDTKGSAVLYSAPERFQILNNYGFSYSEVRAHEKEKFAQKAIDKQNSRTQNAKSSRFGKRILRLLRVR